MFQGKEFDTELSINLYYFEARFYRPDIARFVAPDPMRQGWSNYSFAANNPVRFVDPSGLEAKEAPMRSYTSGYGNGAISARAFFISRTSFLSADNQTIDWWIAWQQYRDLFGEGKTSFTLVPNTDIGTRRVYAKEMPDAFKQEITNWYVRAQWAIDHAAQYGIHVFPGVTNMVDQLAFGDVVLWDFNKQMFDNKKDRIMGLWNPISGGGYNVVLNVNHMNIGTGRAFTSDHITFTLGHEMYHVMMHRTTGEGGIDLGIDRMGNYFGANVYGSQVTLFFNYWFTGQLGLPWLKRP